MDGASPPKIAAQRGALDAWATYAHGTASLAESGWYCMMHGTRVLPGLAPGAGGSWYTPMACHLSIAAC